MKKIVENRDYPFIAKSTPAVLLCLHTSNVLGRLQALNNSVAL